MAHQLPRLITVILFLAGLLFCLVMTVVDPETDTRERRPLSPKPNTPKTLNDATVYPKQFENWWNDRLYERNEQIALFNRLRSHAGISPPTGALIGKDGWLFLNLENTLDDFRNVNLFTADEQERWKRYLMFRHRDARRHGAKYLFVIAPNTASIYGEHMPRHITPLSKTSRIDQIMAIAKESGIDVLDLRIALLAEKPFTRLYLKNDSHWNMRAGNIAQHEIMRALQKHFPDIKPRLHPAEDFYDAPREDFKKADVMFYGGLSHMTGIATEDDYRQPLLKGLPHPCVKKTPMQYGRWQHLIKEPARRYRFGNAWVCESGQYTALVYRDSFLEMIQPYLSSQFRKTTYIWHPRPVSLIAWNHFVAQTKPDIIIDELVERYLRLIPEPGKHYPANFNPPNNNRIVKPSAMPVRALP